MESTLPESISSLFTSGLLIKLLVNAASLFIAAKILDGVEIKSFGKALIVALVLAILNVTLGNYLEDVTGWTVGLLSFLVDAAVLLVASWILDGFKIKGIFWAIILAVVLSLINGLLFRIL